MRRTIPTLVLAAPVILALAVPGDAFGQDRQQAALPDEGVRVIIDFLNAPGTIRFDGPARVPEGTVIEGDVGVLGGSLALEGAIVGTVVVVNGDLVIDGAGRIDGDVTVIGGEIRAGGPETVTGTRTVYDEPLAWARRGDQVVPRTRPGGDEEAGAGLFGGRARFMVRTHGTYSRVEGLPVLFGPVVDGGAADPWRVEAMGLWRSESGLGLDEDELGYLFRGEKRIGAEPTLTLGGSFHSLVTPLPSAGLSELESSLSTFFLHKDFRDYWEREGWSASVGLDLEPIPLRLRLVWTDDEHRFAPVSSPWTLRRNDDPWRPQPLVAEGDLRTLTGEIGFDSRNDPEHPSHGWLIRAGLTRGVDGELALPEAETADPDPVPVPAVPVDEGFTAASVDLRRYNRISPSSELNLRLFWSGSVDGGPLPAQYQTALGGEGTLPGYSLFDLDCGARARRLSIQRVAFDDDQDTTHPVFPYYGCDRAFLMQLEVRSHLPWDLGWGEDSGGGGPPGWFPVLDLDPTLVGFFDLGRGWSESDPDLDQSTVSDLGIGLYLGDVGVHWAWPLNGGGRKLNFFVRLERRF